MELNPLLASGSVNFSSQYGDEAAFLVTFDKYSNCAKTYFNIIGSQGSLLWLKPKGSYIQLELDHYNSRSRPSNPEVQSLLLEILGGERKLEKILDEFILDFYFYLPNESSEKWKKWFKSFPDEDIFFNFLRDRYGFSGEDIWGLSSTPGEFLPEKIGRRCF